MVLQKFYGLEKAIVNFTAQGGFQNILYKAS